MTTLISKTIAWNYDISFICNMNFKTVLLFEKLTHYERRNIAAGCFLNDTTTGSDYRLENKRYF